MWGTIFTVVSLCSLLFYLYGVLISITVTEKNACKMTYMFEYPQFVVSSKIFFLIRNLATHRKTFSLQDKNTYHITSVIEELYLIIRSTPHLLQYSRQLEY